MLREQSSAIHIQNIATIENLLDVLYQVIIDCETYKHDSLLNYVNFE